MLPGDKQKKTSNQAPIKNMTTSGSGKLIKPFVEMKLVTWNKDSHGLFDYESRNVDLKFIKIETSCEIYRISKEKNQATVEKEIGSDGKNEREEFKILDQPVEIPNVGGLNSLNSIFLAAVDFNPTPINGSQFKFNSFRDTLETLNDNLQNQEAYLIVRSLKNQQNMQKGYEIKIGDIVKFGRIEYQVIQIKNDRGETKVKNIEKQIHIQQEIMQIEGSPKTCKICLMEEEGDDIFFCNPCDCKGSCEYVHFDCLKNWVQSKVKCKAGVTTSVYSWKKSDCELCKKPLPKHISFKGKIHDLVDIQIPQEKPYIILESIAKEKKVVKTLFVFSTNVEDNEIKLGRGHSCEVRISDISVSRTHSIIKYQGGKFVIIDNNSKFGTLIKIRDNLDISQDKKAVQIGRTVVTFAQKMGHLTGGNSFQERTEPHIPQPGPMANPNPLLQPNAVVQQPVSLPSLSLTTGYSNPQIPPQLQQQGSQPNTNLYLYNSQNHNFQVSSTITHLPTLQQQQQPQQQAQNKPNGQGFGGNQTNPQQNNEGQDQQPRLTKGNSNNRQL